MRCVYCHGSDGTLDVTCRCLAVYHTDCSIEIRRCATIGCSRQFIARPGWLDRLREGGAIVFSAFFGDMVEPRTPSLEDEPGIFERIDKARETLDWRDLL